MWQWILSYNNGKYSTTKILLYKMPKENLQKKVQTMKQPIEMTMAEIQYLISTHQFPPGDERDNAIKHFNELIHIIDFIEARILAYVPLMCPCDRCNEIRNAKPKRITVVKEKAEPVHFSLD